MMHDVHEAVEWLTIPSCPAIPEKFLHITMLTVTVGPQCKIK